MEYAFFLSFAHWPLLKASMDIVPELFPETKVSASANIEGQIYLRFYDRGGIAPVQGKVAFNSSSASGKETALLSVHVTRGDSFPVKGNSLAISCSVKKVEK